MSSDDTGPETLECHYRVTLDFRVLARAITDEVRQESIFFNDRSTLAGTPEFAEQIEKQRRLYALLRNDRRALEQYLLLVLTQEAGNFVYEGLPDAFDAADEDELMESLYQGMEEEDASYFEECRRMDALAENTDLIATAFKVEWVGAEVTEASNRIVGNVKRAEVVERTKTRLLRKMIS